MDQGQEPGASGLQPRRGPVLKRCRLRRTPPFRSAGFLARPNSPYPQPCPQAPLFPRTFEALPATASLTGAAMRSGRWLVRTLDHPRNHIRDLNRLSQDSRVGLDPDELSPELNYVANKNAWF